LGKTLAPNHHGDYRSINRLAAEFLDHVEDQCGFILPGVVKKLHIGLQSGEHHGPPDPLGNKLSDGLSVPAYRKNRTPRSPCYMGNPETT